MELVSGSWMSVFWRGGEMATRRSAKPPCEGSTPSRASNFIDSPGFVQVLILSGVFDPTRSLAEHIEAWMAVGNGHGRPVADAKSS